MKRWLRKILLRFVWNQIKKYLKQKLKIDIMSFSLKNFGKQNTPDAIQKIGNYLLIGATVGVGIIGLPATLAASGIVFVLPPLLQTVGTSLVIGGVIGKFITKMFGGKVDDVLVYVLVDDDKSNPRPHYMSVLETNLILNTYEFSGALKFPDKASAQAVCNQVNAAKKTPTTYHVEEHGYM